MGLSASFLRCDAAPVIVLDGAYSTRPELADIVDALWDEPEDHYFTNARPPSTFDVLIAMA